MGNAKPYREWTEEQKQRHREATYRWQRENPERWLEIARRSHQKAGRWLYRPWGFRLPKMTRMQAIENCGGKCVRCGFAEVRVLQFDHVNGGGNQERKVRKEPTWALVLGRVWMGDMQLLCANCNVLKSWEDRKRLAASKTVC